MPDETNPYLDANDCLRKASECRQKADLPGEDRVKMLKMAEAWEQWAKIRRMYPATHVVAAGLNRSAPTKPDVKRKR